MFLHVMAVSGAKRVHENGRIHSENGISWCSISFTVLVAAELAGALAGLGYLIQTSALSFRVGDIFIGIVVLALFGFIAVTVIMTILYWLFSNGANRKMITV